MSNYSNDGTMGWIAGLRLRWQLFLRGILHWWVKARVLPEPLTDIDIDPDVPVCYVMDNYALTSLLILDQCCEQAGLPRPLYPLHMTESVTTRSYAALKRKTGLIVRRTSPRSHSRTLKQLVDAIAVADNQPPDVQLIPVTVMIGRAPDKETRIAKIFFSETWEIGGRFRRLLESLVNGRSTLVQFSNPVSLQSLVTENTGEDLAASRSLRKVSRLLRVHFRQVRISAIGPDLSHRRTVVDQLLKSPAVRQAISDKASRDGITEHKAWKAARSHAFEIAANYSYTFVRIASFALTWFWNRIYDGVELNHFNAFRKAAPGYEVIYVPCHRSHIDYLLVSYFLYHNGFVPPHIAAGVNLNLPIIGSLVRKGGAFFLRRSFKAQKLYSAVFNTYVSKILSEGTAIEYFVEGTRSRTGRLLPPMGGMLSMTVRGFLRSPTRPVMFQPIYVGYERLVEGRSYTAELAGRKKKSETLADLLSVFKILGKRYGKVHVSFGEPIFLDDLLNRFEPNWRDQDHNEARKPRWLNPLTDELGTRIMAGINDAAHVNAINLLAIALLAAPKHALGREELEEQLQLYLDLLKDCPYSRRLTVTEKSPSEITDYGHELGIVTFREHPLGEIVALDSERAVRQTYFRNNVSHLFALPSLVTGCFLNSTEIKRTTLEKVVTSIYPFIRSELYLHWDEAGLKGALDQLITWLTSRGLLIESEEGMIRRAGGGSAQGFQLRLMGQALLPTYERYYITVAVLAKNGSGTLTRSELERLCTMTAQRLSLLTEFESPEFYERNLFRQFITLLRDMEILSTTESGQLEFNSMIEQISQDAKLILNKETRHGIMRLAPNILQEAAGDEDQASRSGISLDSR
jgi:glycerol-3-phosphate O-acyltransferase